MSKFIKFFILSLTVLFLFTCERWNLEETNFLELEIEEIESLSLDSVRVSGIIKGLATGQALDHGFIWGEADDEDPILFFNEGSKTLGLKTKDEIQTFSTIIKLKPNTNYKVRAYATTDEVNYVYSNSALIQTGKGTVSSISINYIGGFSLEAVGQLSGTEEGFIAVEHGFCWSSSEVEPTLADQFVNLGLRINNDEFTGTVDGLVNNENTYIRAYAILSFDLKRDTIYGETLIQDGELNFWTQKLNFPAEGRTAGVSFTIGEKAYLGTGVMEGFIKMSDFWEYDPSTDSWTQKADFAGGPISNATGFAIDSKGYLGTGLPLSTTFTQSKEFWEYNPFTNVWTQKADFPGTERNSAIGFSIGSKGYLGLGQDTLIFEFITDLWEYDPNTDSWTQKSNLPGEGRRGAACFTINGKGYIGPGLGDSFTLLDDFWEYDPNTDIWNQKADFGGGATQQAVGFSIGDRGFMGTGRFEPTQDPRSDFWEYIPSTDSWIRRDDYQGGGRVEAFGFSIGSKGYITMGQNIDNNKTIDIWEFDP